MAFVSLIFCSLTKTIHAYVVLKLYVCSPLCPNVKFPHMCTNEIFFVLFWVIRMNRMKQNVFKKFSQPVLNLYYAKFERAKVWFLRMKHALHFGWSTKAISPNFKKTGCCKIRTIDTVYTNRVLHLIDMQNAKTWLIVTKWTISLEWRLSSI